MAYGRRRSTRRTSRGGYTTRRRTTRRSYGRAPARRSRARSGRSTVRIELVTAPATGVARPEHIGLMAAAPPKNKPTF